MLMVVLEHVRYGGTQRGGREEDRVWALDGEEAGCLGAGEMSLAPSGPLRGTFHLFASVSTSGRGGWVRGAGGVKAEPLSLYFTDLLSSFRVWIMIFMD